PAAEVRRECAIALRHLKDARAADLWARLAQRHDGKDRWYLEALGIGADRQWDAYFDALLKREGDRVTRTPAWRDVVWRSRARKTPENLAKIIRERATPADELPRYFRAFDFQSGKEKTAALMGLVTAEPEDDAGRKDLILQESVKRLKGVDPRKHPEFA